MTNEYPKVEASTTLSDEFKKEYRGVVNSYPYGSIPDTLDEELRDLCLSYIERAREEELERILSIVDKYAYPLTREKLLPLINPKE